MSLTVRPLLYRLYVPLRDGRATYIDGLATLSNGGESVNPSPSGRTYSRIACGKDSSQQLLRDTHLACQPPERELYGANPLLPASRLPGSSSAAGFPPRQGHAGGRSSRFNASYCDYTGTSRRPRKPQKRPRDGEASSTRTSSGH